METKNTIDKYYKDLRHKSDFARDKNSIKYLEGKSHNKVKVVRYYRPDLRRYVALKHRSFSARTKVLKKKIK